LLHYSHDFIEKSFAMANEFVLTPAAWLQPTSLFTTPPKAAQRVLEFSARRSITISLENLNRHHFLLCNDVLQPLPPLCA
jgi:hypothetical protein